MEFIDLFCGAGGLSLGLREAGLKQRLAVDSDKMCIATYRHNFPRSNAMIANIEDLNAQHLLGAIDNKKAFVLAGGPPCQLFSRLHQKQPGGDHVIFAYLKLVSRIRAPYLVFENVPQIAKYPKVWSTFLRTLSKTGYHVWTDVVDTVDLGLPQARRRLVVIASLKRPVTPRLQKRQPQTVRDSIGDLPEADDSIPNHVAMALSRVNLRRLRSIKSEGGCWRKGGQFTDSYARMYWDRPAPTITTRCISFSNGRFGHPEFDRALTVREAARLQGFRDDFIFEGGVWVAARQVGNAVPPPLARWLGRTILKHAAG